MRRRIAAAFTALLLLLGPAASETRAEAGSACSSLAVFGTTCARCHEAECSGRLTFDDLARASAHVERYTGPLPDERVAELIGLLRVTKEQCRVDAEATASCGGSPWDAARLRDVHVAAERAWFVPLGTAPGGAQRVRLRFDRDVGVHLRISTARFDVVHEARQATRERAIEAAFDAPVGEPLYLRAEIDRNATLLELGVAAGGR